MQHKRSTDDEDIVGDDDGVEYHQAGETTTVNEEAEANLPLPPPSSVQVGQTHYNQLGGINKNYSRKKSSVPPSVDPEVYRQLYISSDYSAQLNNSSGGEREVDTEDFDRGKGIKSKKENEKYIRNKEREQSHCVHGLPLGSCFEIECSRILGAKIISSERRVAGHITGKLAVEYQVLLTFKGSTATIWHRYSAFRTLYYLLLARYKYVPPPTAPVIVLPRGENSVNSVSEATRDSEKSVSSEATGTTSTADGMSSIGNDESGSPSKSSESGPTRKSRNPIRMLKSNIKSKMKELLVANDGENGLASAPNSMSTASSSTKDSQTSRQISSQRDDTTLYTTTNLYELFPPKELNKWSSKLTEKRIIYLNNFLQALFEDPILKTDLDINSFFSLDYNDRGQFYDPGQNFTKKTQLFVNPIGSPNSTGICGPCYAPGGGTANKSNLSNLQIQGKNVFPESSPNDSRSG